MSRLFLFASVSFSSWHDPSCFQSRFSFRSLSKLTFKSRCCLFQLLDVVRFNRLNSFRTIRLSESKIDKTNLNLLIFCTVLISSSNCESPQEPTHTKIIKTGEKVTATMVRAAAAGWTTICPLFAGQFGKHTPPWRMQAEISRFT